MRKISKISLVAAVAVAGFSTANAQPLEQAIKDVEVSGSVVYRYDNYHSKRLNEGQRPGTDQYLLPGQINSKDTDMNRYKIGLNLSSKVNDYVKFNSRFIVGGEDNGFASLNAKTAHYEYTGSPTERSDGDKNADVSLSNAYFGLTAIPNTVVNIGKQGLTTPYTVATDINGNEQNGTGVLALTNIDAVTFGAGYFNNSNLDAGTTDINGSFGITGANTRVFSGLNPTGSSVVGNVNILEGSKDLYVATVQGDLDFVKLESWYLGMQDTFGSYTLAATSKLDLASDAKLGLEARYVNLQLNDRFATGRNTIINNNTQLETDNSMFRFAVDGKFNIVNARIAYTKTGKDGGLTAVDQDAKNASLGWAITSNAVADADYWQAALGADILDNLNFTLNYGQLKAGDQTSNRVARAANLVSVDNVKQEEVYGQLTYKMSKNLSTYLRYGTYELKYDSTDTKREDNTRGRIQVAYTF